jgi:proteasome assembly chaperone (PAC2) family protein
MSDLLNLQEIPQATEIYMLAGWRQWADAGNISSGLPEYLVKLTNARKIGDLSPQGYYIFQVPGTHHLLRPMVQLEDGFARSLERKRNELFYAEIEGKGLLIFLGDEPQLNVEQYVQAFFAAVERLGVKRVTAVGGVYGSLPYDKERDISVVYSLRPMKTELEEYAVRFSSYEGGATIGVYLLAEAAQRDIEFIDMYAFAPAYDFSAENSFQPQGLRIENDFKAWFDILRRLRTMWGISLDLVDLEEQSIQLVEMLEAKLRELAQESPELDIQAYFARLAEQFEERPFFEPGDVWAQELRDLFDEE